MTNFKTITNEEIKNINFEKEVVRYTVSLDTLKEGTITAIELLEIKVGDFKRNVQFVDDFGNKMGRNGTITEIKKIEIFGSL